MFKIDGFEWDHGNLTKSLKKHGISHEETEEIFLNQRVFLFPDIKHSHQEARYIAFGKTKTGKSLTVVFTLRKATL